MEEQNLTKINLVHDVLAKTMEEFHLQVDKVCRTITENSTISLGGYLNRTKDLFINHSTYGISIVQCCELSEINNTYFTNQEHADRCLLNLSEEKLKNLLEYFWNFSNDFYEDEYSKTIVEDIVFLSKNNKHNSSTILLLSLIEPLIVGLNSCFDKDKTKKWYYDAEKIEKYFFSEEKDRDKPEILNKLDFKQYLQIFTIYKIALEIFKSTDKASTNTPNRHSVFHGKQEKSFTKVDNIKLLLFVLSVIELFI